MTVRIFHGARRVAEVPADDRGLAYGDGLFETMRAHRGRVHWWDAHWSRLTTGSARLKLPLPAESLVRAEAEALLEGDDGVLKLLVTRGRGGRGYAPPGEATPTWLLSTHALPVSPAEGLALRWCDTRLAVQPLLAGLKHCNRLEQVMARAEWTLTLPGDTAFRADEGLMRSTAGDVVCATSANLFVLRGGQWCTPAVDQCGVAGVCRAWVVDTLNVAEVRLDVTEVEAAEAIFLCNAVRGILPVARLGERTWMPHLRVAELQQRLAAEHPAFAPEYS